ncbi:MAG: penicillin acylase family protein [Acidobacteria bacterium]|nr:penicillin acylase family protein [Acidobacteriota bacterium]
MRFLPLLLALAAFAEDLQVAGLQRPVEILRDKWGIPHIYAQSQSDLFFAQGYVTARDRLFQIDLWRRIGTGKLAEVAGPQAIARDRIARLVRFRGDWNAEWQAYSPDAKEIATAFTNGINAYIESLNGTRPLEFRLAGYDPGKWVPEDTVARIAGLLMIRNPAREVQRAQDVLAMGLEAVQKYMPPDPFVQIKIPNGLDLAGIHTGLMRDYNAAIGGVQFTDQIGSNNWVVSGERSVTGKPLLANDPHRPIMMPSLRKSVHLVGPGWNAIGSGEPALPGIALGHNEDVAFGFTIVGIDQGDVYVEKLNPSNPDEYEYKGQWRKIETVDEEIGVRGSRTPHRVKLRYTLHGPVIAEDLGRHRVYALKWVGSEPGSAGYMGALALARARNWDEFRKAAAGYKIPSENLVYADRTGNIGWIASGWSPIRKNWTGLLPVPGHTGEYEWGGYLSLDQHPQKFNPPEGAIWTANHKILPAGYSHQLGYEWASPFRAGRVEEMLLEKRKFSVEDFQRMQQDVTSHPARYFVNSIVKPWLASPGAKLASEAELAMAQRVAAWDARLEAGSTEAIVFEYWTAKLPQFVFGPKVGAKTDLIYLLRHLRHQPDPKAMSGALRASMEDLTRQFGADPVKWKWGNVHTVTFRHPLTFARQFHRGPHARPGDGNTVNSTSGGFPRQQNGASYRQIIDVSDWDKSVMTNVPGESGNPESPFYDNLIEEWLTGGYHPMLYSRRAVEAATVERIRLNPR